MEKPSLSAALAQHHNRSSKQKTTKKLEKYPKTPKNFNLAGKLGFEPKLRDPESRVLPLNYFPSAKKDKILEESNYL